MSSYRGGRVTLGLYNSYDPQHFHEAMRRAVARAAPLAASFEFNLALIGFPFEAYRTKSGETPRPKTPKELAALVADSTTIGEGGEYLLELAEAGRFQSYPFPDPGFAPQLGTPVLATRHPAVDKRIDLDALARHVHAGSSVVVLVGLGPRGVPKKVHEACPRHLELTDKQYSLETATALGVLAGRLWDALETAKRPVGPRLSVDAIVEREGHVLLVRRGAPPFAGAWALPGGFVDVGETVEAAVLRELREETGLRGRGPALVGVYSDPARDARGHTVALVFAVCADGPPRAGDDAAEARFHPWDALPPLAFDHGSILRDYRARLPKRAASAES